MTSEKSSPADNSQTIRNHSILRSSRHRPFSNLFTVHCQTDVDRASSRWNVIKGRKIREIQRNPSQYWSPSAERAAADPYLRCGMPSLPLKIGASLNDVYPFHFCGRICRPQPSGVQAEPAEEKSQTVKIPPIKTTVFDQHRKLFCTPPPRKPKAERGLRHENNNRSHLLRTDSESIFAC